MERSEIWKEGAQEENPGEEGGDFGGHQGNLEKISSGMSQRSWRPARYNWNEQLKTWKTEDEDDSEDETSWNEWMAERKIAVAKRVYGEKGGNTGNSTQSSESGRGKNVSEKVNVMTRKEKTEQGRASQGRSLNVQRVKIKTMNEGKSEAVQEGSPANLARAMKVFDNPDLVQNILSHLTTVQDLKNLRRVCKLFLAETMPVWRNKVVLVLKRATIMVLLRAYVQGENVDEDLPQLERFPFKKYRFPESEFWSYPLEENDEDFTWKNNLWTSVLGANALYVDIGQSKLRKREGQDTYISGMEWILRAVPNLHELTLDPLCDEDAVTNLVDLDFSAPNLTTLHVSHSAASSFETKFLFHRQDVERFLRMLPNLKNITVFGERAAGSILSVLRGFRNNDNQGQRGQVETFKAFGIEERSQFEFEDGLVRYLEVFKNVKELEFPIGASEIIDQSREGFRIMSLVSATIEKLILRVGVGYYRPPQSTLAFSHLRFSRLTELTLQMDYRDDDQNAETAISFPFKSLVNMPNLRRFVFYTTKPEAVRPPELTRLAIRESHPGFDLNNLTHFCYYGSFGRLALKELGLIGPNIRYLQMRFLKENLGVLKTCFTNLRILRQLYNSQLWEKDLKELTTALPGLKISKMKL